MFTFDEWNKNNERRRVETLGGVEMNRRLGIMIAFVLLLVGSIWYVMPTEKTSSVSAGKVTVEDGMKRTVQLEKPAQKVVTLTATDTEIMFALGVKPIGTVNLMHAPQELQKQISQIEKVGIPTAVNVEQVIHLKPDLVVAGAMPFQTTLTPAFERAGLTVYHSAAPSIAGIQENISRLGLLVGKEKEAKSWNDKIRSKIATVKKSQRSDKKIMIIWGTPNSFHLASSQTLVGDLFSLFGYNNIADEVGHKKMSGFGIGFVPLNVEYMAKVRPDEIYLIAHGSPEGVMETFAKAFREQPSWQAIPAVQAGNIKVLPYHLFGTNPGIHVIEAVEYIEDLK